jgi:hypothetical protein
MDIRPFTDHPNSDYPRTTAVAKVVDYLLSIGSLVGYDLAHLTLVPEHSRDLMGMFNVRCYH